MIDLFAGLPKSMRQSLVTEAIRLIAALGDGPEKFRAEELRKIYLPDTGRNGSSSVAMGRYPVAGMLQVRPAFDVARVNNLNWLRGWALAGALRFIHEYPDERDHHSRVVCGLRTVRNLVTHKYDHDPLVSLADFTHDIGSLQTSFGTLAAHYANRGSPLAVQLRHLELTLLDASLPRAPRIIGSVSQATTADENGIRRKVIETPDASIIMETEDPVSAETPPEEIDESYKLAYYLLPPQTSHPRTRGWEREAQMSLLFESENASTRWRADFAALTAQETRCVFAAAFRDACLGDRGAKLVLAVLVSGRSIETLVTARNRPLRGVTWLGEKGRICFAPDVTGGGDAKAGGFALCPPPELWDWCDPWPDLVTAERAVTAWIATQDMGRRLRMTRVIRALSDGLILRGTDMAIVGLLCGIPCAQLVQLHYARVSIARLDHAWRETLKAHFGAPEGFQVKSLTRHVTEIGSVLAPSQSQVAAWFTELLVTVRQARQAAPNDMPAFVQRVAAETNLACSVLEFQCARRPLNAAFEPFNQIVGSKRPQVRLTGKGSRQVDDGRWVPLCLASQQVLKMWRKTLADLLASKLCSVNRSLGVMMNTILAEEACPFFEWNDIEAAPVPLSASQLHHRVGAPKLGKDPARVAELHTTRTNWARHFMRHALMEADVPGRVIDGFFAHGGAVSDPLAPVSAASMADADILRKAIDHIWDDLGVDVSGLAQ